MKVTIVLTLNKTEGGEADNEEVAEEVAQLIENSVDEVTCYDEQGDEVIFEVRNVWWVEY